MRYADVQRRMLEIFDELMVRGSESGRLYGKCSGDICCRILKAFLQKAVGAGFRISEPNAYVRGHPREFDLLIVRAGAKPLRYTNVFQAQDVRCAIEVKAHGTGYSSAPDADVEKLYDRFLGTSRSADLCHIGQVYFTFQESSPIRPGGIDYWKSTSDGLKEFHAFCLRNRRKRDSMYAGEWQRFVSRIQMILRGQ